MKKIAVLGCTGSIGRSTFKVIDQDSDLKPELIVNYSDLSGLKHLIDKYKPSVAVCVSAGLMYKDGREYTVSENIIEDPEIYSSSDIAVNGIAGLSGLKPSLAVLNSGIILATANKESFVCAGQLINSLKKQLNSRIYPIDSEHSALWQLSDGRDVKKLYITASGGAFRDKSKEELASCKAAEALKHPNWVMGKKVTIDCATLLNKGMEIIEAKHLFGIKPSVIGHRESYVHALVQYVDGTYNANISKPDMIVPISYALHYPDVVPSSVPELDLSNLTFNFFEPDRERFPCLKIAEEISDYGDISGCVLNAADEILVDAYLKDKIGFYGISDGISRALNKFSQKGDFRDVSDVFGMDKEVREYTLSMLEEGLL